MNYPGFEAIEGPQLVDRFQKQLFDDPKLVHQICEVTAIEKSRKTFRVRTADGQTFRSQTVLLAMGMRRRRLEIPGEPDFRGKGVLEYHDLLAEHYAEKDVAVVGGGNSAAQAALGLAKRKARVRLVARSYRADSYLQEELAAQKGVTVLEGRDPVRLEGSERLERLVVRNQETEEEETLPVEAVFAEIGLLPNNELVRELVIINERERSRSIATAVPAFPASTQPATSRTRSASAF